jgi:hypothetical protein
MTTSARSARLVSGLAVVAVSVAAMATVASSWVDRHGDAAVAAARAQRPAADEPVNVVKAPPLADASQHPASCRDCPSPRPMESRL